MTAPLAILWDLDGTLVDSEPLHEHALEETLRHYGVEPPPEIHRAVLGRDVRAEYDIVAARFGLAVPFATWIRQKTAVYFDSLPTLEPRPGALEVWHAMAEAGAHQAVVSNSDRMVLHANLSAVGLLAHGMVTVARNDVREGKPAPEGYLRGAWLLGAAPERAVVVEDSRTGATAGLAAGFRTLLWPQIDLDPPPGAERVGTADDLAAALRALLP